MAELSIQTADVKLSGASNANSRWLTRSSLLVTVSSAELCAHGEAAPLPNFSEESLQQSRAALHAFKDQPVFELGSTLAPQNCLEQLPSFPGAPPSVQFALQSAWLDAVGQRLQTPAWKLLSTASAGFLGASHSGRPSSPLKRPAARLFSLDRDDFEADVQRLSDAPALKVKIGRSLATEKKRLSHLRSLWSKPLRLDANGSLGTNWETELAELAQLKPEFVEEPRPLGELGEPRRLPCPIALDESLLSSAPQDVERWLETGSVAALVLKPMLLGDLHRLYAWVKLARRYHVACVFSHLFDGRVAMACYEHLSMAWGSPDICSGLGEHSGLALWKVRSFSLSAPGLGLVLE